MGFKKNYTKTPVKISSLIPNVLKKCNSGGNVKLLELKMNWQKIFGNDLSEKCFVSSIRKVNNKNILYVTSNQNNLFEISYSSSDIKKKINDFFMHNFIDEIRFKKKIDEV
tara:strand:+ start:180 stop:512 length:333 start_codon:yes stop_codon:yes gene_type:complete